MAAQLEEQAVVIREPEQLTASQVRAQVNLVQEVMKAVMKTGTHYGTVPGCGDKPTLLKPGAEKLASTFRLAINPEVEDMSSKDVARYRVKATICHQVTGAFLGAGVGECSSNEEKYGWRKAVCDEEYNETAEDKRRKKWMKKYDKVSAIQQIRTNPADVANTVLKMAKKRALVDGILTVTGASDIFTQDIEDMPEELLDRRPQAPKPQPVVQPPPPPHQQSDAWSNEAQYANEPPPFDPPMNDDPPVPPPSPAPKADHSGNLISEPQRKRLYAIARGAGCTDAEFKSELERMGYHSSKEVTREAYEDVVTYFQNLRK